jgi:hypothetical protein
MIPAGGGAGRAHRPTNGHGAGARVELFRAWLVRFGDAWEARDPGAITALFAPGAVVQPDPFRDAVRGKPGILAYWAELLGMASADRIRGGSTALSFEAEVLGAGERHGVAHWTVTDGGHVRDGILLAAFDASGRCTSFRQWWHASDAERGGASPD